jgi:hypothetical protein
MPSSLRALLRDVVDYAGFFPPAGLPLRGAFRNYAAYRRSDDAWMLGRFVCTASHLAPLDDAASALFEENTPPFRFSVLAGRGDDPAAFLRELEHDLHRIRQFHRRHGEAVRVEAVEMHLPADLLTGDTATLNEFLRDMLAGAEDARRATPAFFLEIPLNEQAARHATFVTGALAGRDEAAFGLKLRCGGPVPADHPAPDHLSDAVLACLRQDVPFKATAGLHHPFRRYDDDAETMMHGFVNLFGGAALAAEHDLSAGELRRILSDDEPDRFAFDDDTLHWQDLSVSSEALRRVRRSVALSFGSCSFDEPRADLRALGLL